MDKRVFKLSEVVVVIVITALLSAIITGFVSFNTYRTMYKTSSVNLTNDKDLREFLEVYAELVTEYYVDIDRGELLDSAISGMTEYLNENYTNHLSKGDTEDLYSTLSGEYEGIGISLRNDLTIVEVFDNTPAKLAGLEVNDVITWVNGVNVKDYISTDVVQLIKNDEDKEVTIGVNRDGKELTFNIQLKTIDYPSVTSSIEEGTNIGYISISTFTNTTARLFTEHLTKLENEGIDSLIIDLRDNGGGYLVSAKQIASLFIEKGKTLYYLEDKNNKIEYKDETNDKREYPIVILINGSSASASEILTSALVDSYGAKTVGKTSFGKGKVQQTKELTNGTMIKYTTAKWLRPNDNCIDGIGIVPDYEIELKIEKNTVIDTQYNKAIELLKSK